MSSNIASQPTNNAISSSFIETRHRDWAIYPESSYKHVDSLHDGLLHGTSESLPLGLSLPSGSLPIHQWVTKRLQTFLNNGMQQSVAAVILCHNHCSPQVMMLDISSSSSFLPDHHGLVDPTELISDKNGMVSEPSTYLTLPIFKCERWERPFDVLESRLSKFINYRGKQPLQKQTVHEQRPRTKSSTTECLTDVGINNTIDSTLLDSHLIDGNISQNKEDTLLYSDIIYSKANELCEQSTYETVPIVEDSCNTKPPLQLSPSLKPTTGSLLGTWWITDFGIPPLPYLPQYVTRPKEQIHLYQVFIPGECDFYFPCDESNSLKIRFVSFDYLTSITESGTTPLGPGYAGLPSLVSCYSLTPMQCRPVEKSLTNIQTCTSGTLPLVSISALTNRQDYQVEEPSDRLMTSGSEDLTDTQTDTTTNSTAQ